MTPEQLEKLQALREKLVDMTLVEVDPGNWCGSGKAPKDLTQSERGDAVWCRKQATASLGVLARIDDLAQGNPMGEPPAVYEDPDDLEQEMKEAMQAGERLLQRLHVAE